jgi:hypothetical protein
MLSEGSFSKITISSLAKKAKVNHNTIYYYFENIDDMVIKLFHKNIPLEIPNAILSFATTGDNRLTNLLSNQDLMIRWMRARLFIRGDSAFLMNCYKKSITNAWFNTTAINHENLTDTDKVVMDFIISGLIAVIGSPLVGANPNLLSQLLELNIGKEIVSALSCIAKCPK